MLNKKGFTLIELLAVIAILAILIVLAVPNILNIFNDSKERAFLTQAQSIYKTAETQYVSAQLSPTPVTAFCNAADGSTTLDLEAPSNVKYSIVFTNGKISSFKVTDGTYTYTNTSINSISDISAVSSTAWAGTACD